VIVPFGSLVEIPLPLPPPFNTPSSVVGALALGALVIHLIGERVAGGRGRPPWVPDAIAWWVAFAGVAALSFLWSVNPIETIQELSILWSLVALYALAAFARTTSEDLRRFEVAIVLGGVVASCYALVLLVSAGLPTFGESTPRFAAAGGVEGEAGPNETAAALLLPLAIAAGRAVDPQNPRRGRWIAASGMIAIAIALTASRGGLLSMGVVITIVAWDAGRLRLVGFLGAAALAALLIVPTFGAAALQERLFKESSSGRTLIWRRALQACDRHCLAGSGYGTFPDVYNEASGVSAQITGQKLRQRAHNIWIRVGIETGLAGLVLMSGALYLQWRDLRRLPRPFRGPPLAGFLGVLCANVFLSNIGFKYFWLAMIHAMLTTVVWHREPVAARAWVDAQTAPPDRVRLGLGTPA
jgi:O-antigen ligase